MRFLRFVLLVALVVPVVSAPAADSPPVVTTPATAAEIAYWKKLQAELAEFRAANAAYATRIFIKFNVSQLNDIMSRTEKFLDAREGDDVSALGADLQEYRKQLMAMLDGSLTPLRLAAQGHGFSAGSANFNPQKAMEFFLRANSQLEVVDGFKSELYRLHVGINKRVVAAGGPRILFFRTLNLGDSSDFEYAQSTPAQRDEKFVAASRAIEPSLGVTAEKRFLKYRRDGRTADQIMLKRDEFITGVLDLMKQVANLSDEQLDKEQKGIPADAPAENKAMFDFVFALERLRRTNPIAQSVMLENWKAVFAQWLGKADELTPPDGCNDLAVSQKQGWFAFTPDGKTVEGRSLETGDLVFTATTGFTIKGLAFGTNGSLYAFTTGGMQEMAPPAGTNEGTFTAVNDVSYQTLVGAFSAATERARFAYAWGGALTIADDGHDMLFHATSSSVITVTDIDRAGRHILVGYSGRDNTGANQIRHGIDILDVPDSSQELAQKSVASRAFNPAFAAPVTAGALSFDGQFAVISTGVETFGTVELYHFVKPAEPDTTQLALDNQPYNFVAIAGEGDDPAVVAGTRNGTIRVWSAKTGGLIARYVVPSGPQGIALAVTGDQLVTANLGSPGIYRWSVRDGKLLATLNGEAPKIDEAKLAAELKAEQARRPIIARYLALRDIKETEAKVAEAKKFLADDKAALEAAGLYDFVQSSIANAYEAELKDLADANKYPELYKRGKDLLAQGVDTRDIWFYLLVGANRIKAADIEQLYTKATETYPESTDIAYLQHRYLSDKYAAAGNIDAAFKEIDKIDELRPEDAPHKDLRVGLLYDGAENAYKAGNQQRALDLYLKAFEFCETKEEQLNVLPSIFSIAYGLSNWALSAKVASMIIELDASKKNDSQFMDAARYAYQMYQQQGGK